MVFQDQSSSLDHGQTGFARDDETLRVRTELSTWGRLDVTAGLTDQVGLGE